MQLSANNESRYKVLAFQSAVASDVLATSASVLLLDNTSLHCHNTSTYSCFCSVDKTFSYSKAFKEFGNQICTCVSAIS